MINLIFTKETGSESLYRFSTPSEKEKNIKSPTIQQDHSKSKQELLEPPWQSSD